jgi:hypothetical protein
MMESPDFAEGLSFSLSPEKHLILICQNFFIVSDRCFPALVSNMCCVLLYWMNVSGNDLDQFWIFFPTKTFSSLIKVLAPKSAPASSLF